MSRIIDRRPNSRHKSAVNRRRFLNRVKAQLKKAVSNSISGRSITDMEAGDLINIPKKDVSEPSFRHGEGGVRNIILPGNKDFVPGDRIKRPQQQSNARGSQASPQGEGEDSFSFNLSREEFLDIFFEDLELPNLVRKEIVKAPTNKTIRSGFTTDGVPTNINIIRSMRSAISRRIAIGNKIKKQLKQHEQELAELLTKKNIDSAIILELQQKIKKLKIKLNKIPFIDPFDLRYNSKITVPMPATQAVMFCVMDVSGSMDEAKKDIAKRFFILLYLFLKRNYERIDIVFIRHHTCAKEVNEQEFFYSRETGGTVVSSALELMQEIIKQRYPTSHWNIYGAQASDGDNWNNDSPRCRDLLAQDIMPFVQYFAYVEIMPRHHQSLWEEYLNIKTVFPNFAMQDINSARDIYPVFHKLFKKNLTKAKPF